MFGWLKRSAKPAADAAKASDAPAQTASAPGPAAPTPAASAEPARTPLEASTAAAPDAPSAVEPPPKVGMAALEIAATTRRKAVVTLVHPDHERLVARIVTTGTAYSYARQPDGTYRLAGRAKPDAPRLVLGAE